MIWNSSWHTHCRIHFSLLLGRYNNVWDTIAKFIYSARGGKGMASRVHSTGDFSAKEAHINLLHVSR